LGLTASHLIVFETEHDVDFAPLPRELIRKRYINITKSEASTKNPENPVPDRSL
jgi:hypothetical protein